MNPTTAPLSQGLQLDERQRAMLAEMGVRLWWPADADAEPVNAAASG